MRLSLNALRLLVLIELFNIGVCNAQRFYSVVFTDLPQDMQLYARDDNNVASIPINGFIELPDWDHVSVVTFRNKKRIGVAKSNINYAVSNKGTFSLSTSIKAETADYDIEVYVCKNATDSVLIVKRTEIIAGDFYVVSGQSNAAATIYGTWSSKYCRTVARIPDNDPTITAGDTLWINASWSHTYVGAWELEMQKSILENEGIPTCVINGSLPGAKLSTFLDRDSNNPANPVNLSGLLLHRVRKSKATRIRAFIWMHGEQEVFESIPGYDVEYSQLYKNWTIDYPQADQFIVVQTNLILLNYTANHSIPGEIRDFLRRTKSLYPKTETFTSIGTPFYDGVHYERNGYEEFGRRFYRFLAPTRYGRTTDENTKCPDIQKVFYSTSEKKEITIIFDQGQELRWPKDTVVTGQNGSPITMSLKNLFYLNGDETSFPFKSGAARNNVVTLSLNSPGSAAKISYLPSFYPNNLPLREPASFNIGLFNGPYLINKNNLGAFSFNNVVIGDPLEITKFSSEESPSGSVMLKWDLVKNATSYILERRLETDQEFTKIKDFETSSAAYEDRNVLGNTRYIYRLEALNNNAESAPKETSITFSPILAIEPTSYGAFQAYPNPTKEVLYIVFKKPVSGQILVTDAAGQKIQTDLIVNKTEYSVRSSKWPSGVYVISLQDSQNKSVLTAKIIKD